MHFHPYLPKSELHKIGIWEDNGNIVGVVHFEFKIGEIYFEFYPDYSFLKPAMLDYAENELCAKLANQRRYLRIHINDFDSEFENIAKARGYKKVTHLPDYTATFKIAHPFPMINLPKGFILKSLADDNNLKKINRVLHRGFNHPGEPLEKDIEGRRHMQSAPNFKKDLNIVIQAPNGDFVSYSGIWFEPTNKFGNLEPVATDPDYRFMGLGKAAVLECVRRVGELGATIVYVGSGQAFYETIGFSKLFAYYPWIKYFEV
jgi:ribosomal protein S18 acetylase RimI-like enzyme